MLCASCGEGCVVCGGLCHMEWGAVAAPLPALPICTAAAASDPNLWAADNGHAHGLFCLERAQGALHKPWEKGLERLIMCAAL